MTDSDDPPRFYNVTDLMTRLAERVRFKFEEEKKFPDMVPEYRRTHNPMVEIDAVIAGAKITLAPEFYDKSLTLDQLTEAYCSKRKETAAEKRKHSPSHVHAKADEKDDSLSVLLSGVRKLERGMPNGKQENESIPTQAVQSPRDEKPETPGPAQESPSTPRAIPSSGRILDSSFADSSDSDF